MSISLKGSQRLNSCKIWRKNIFLLFSMEMGLGFFSAKTHQTLETI